MDKNWLARLRWALSLDQPTLTHRLGKVSATELVYSNNNKLLNISNLAINDHRQTGNPLTVNLFTLDKLTMSEIDYRNFVLTHTLDFGTLLLSHPRVQIEIAKKTTAKNTTQGRHKIIDLNELPFSFCEIKLEDMQVELTQLDSVNHSHFNLGEVDLKITGQKPASQHLTDHLTFAIQGFSFADDNRSQQLSIEKINYNPQNGTLSMDQLTGSRKDADTAITVLSYAILRGEFGRFKVSNSLPSEISFGSIRLNHPQLHHQSREGTHIAHKADTTPTHIKLPWQLEKFTIDTLILNHLDVYHTEIHPSGEITTHLKDLRVEVNHIGVDTTGLNTNDFSFVESTRIQTGNNSFVSSDSLYVTELKAIGYNFSTNTLTLDSLQIVPRYPDAEFFKKAQFQTDQIHLFGERMVGNNFRFTSFLNTGDIHLGSLDIYGLDARLFRNKNYPTNPADYKKMPQEMMLDVNKPFLIDSIRTHDAEIHYKEVVEKAKDPGYIFFDQFNLSLYNLTNIPERLATDSILRANLKARVMGKTNLNLNLFVDITSPTREFWFSGYTESIEFTALNPVTQNLVGVDMQGGEGRVLIPLIKGDSSHTSGRVVFLYKKLKVGLYNREKARSTTGLARGMANILLNDIFIRSNNPTFLRKPKTGVVYSDRVTQKSFVFYVWKSILSGMLSTFGINTRQQRHEKRTMNAPSD